MKGQTVRIIVHEPENRTGKNLFGRILSDRNGKFTIEVRSEITGDGISGKRLMLIPIEDKHPAKSLTQYASLSINGYLISENAEPQYIFTGTVTID